MLYHLDDVEFAAAVAQADYEHHQEVRAKVARDLADCYPAMVWRQRLLAGLEQRARRLRAAGQTVPRKLRDDIRRHTAWVDDRIDEALRASD